LQIWTRKYVFIQNITCIWPDHDKTCIRMHQAEGISLIFQNINNSTEKRLQQMIPCRFLQGRWCQVLLCAPSESQGLVTTDYEGQLSMGRSPINRSYENPKRDTTTWRPPIIKCPKLLPFRTPLVRPIQLTEKGRWVPNISPQWIIFWQHLAEIYLVLTFPFP